MLIYAIGDFPRYWINLRKLMLLRHGILKQLKCLLIRP